MNVYRLLIIFLCLSLPVCFAENTNRQLQTVVKPYLHSFTQARVDLRRDTTIFKQEKVIFGLDFKFNEYWSARVGIDLINMNKPYLKPAVLTFNKDQWTVDGGIFFTSDMDLSLQQFWGNRFIDRVAADKWICPTADLGLRLTYRWSEWMSTDVSVVSGNGYQLLTEKYNPKPALRVIISPLQTLKAGGYVAARKDRGIIETTYGSFAHWQRHEQWKITGEYYCQTNSRFAKSNRMDIVSVYGAYSLLSWWEIIGRFDLLKSGTKENYGKSWHTDDGQSFIGGFIFQCFPTMRFSVNYLRRRPSTVKINNEDWIYMCLEFKF